MLRKSLIWVPTVFLVVIGLVSLLSSGQLDPPAPPGPTMKTLDEIPPTWNQILPTFERFELVMGGASVLDKETGLVWEQSPDPTTRTWTQAVENCFLSGTGGRFGWRLPQIEEFVTLLVATGPSSSMGLPSGHPFSSLQTGTSDRYWSATGRASDTSRAYATYLGSGTGIVFVDLKTSSNLWWCVRGGQGLHGDH